MTQPVWLEALLRQPAWQRVLAPDPPARKTRPLGGPLPVKPEHIPLELKVHRGWACWRYTDDSAGRTSKPPFQPASGERAEPSNMATWSSYDDAWAAYREGGTSDHPAYDGISFALWEPWGIVGVDLDHVSAHDHDARRFVDELDSYTEHTPGGDGLRIFVRGTLPPGRRRRDWVEMYSARRFLTVTGQQLPHASPTLTSSPRALYSLWYEFLEHG